MTIENLLNKARKDAEEKLSKWYFDICDGEDVEEYVLDAKASGEYEYDLRRFTMDNIFSAIRTIRNTKCMSDSEKEQAIIEIRSCHEYQETEKEVAMVFKNHFAKCRDIYLK